jgi:hypothetical protein
LSFEKSRKICRFTVSRIATILVSFKNSTRIVTTARNLQLIGALPVDISGTSSTTGAPIRHGVKFHSNIKPINKRDVEEVQVVILVQSELGKGVWGYTISLALEKPATVTGLAIATSRTIKITPCSRPNVTPCSSGINIKAPCFTLVELPAATGYRPRPNSEEEIVGYVISSCMG